MRSLFERFQTQSCGYQPPPHDGTAVLPKTAQWLLLKLNCVLQDNPLLLKIRLSVQWRIESISEMIPHRQIRFSVE